jgi:hypothetical protein
MRLLPLEGQLVPVADYKALVDAVWRGPSANATAETLYRCSADGTVRGAEGTHLCLPDARGLFPRFAGANSIYKGAGDAPYDGKSPGEFIGDAIRNITGVIADVFGGLGMDTNGVFNSIFGDTNIRGNDAGRYGTIEFDSGRAVPIAHENRPASISFTVYISY